MMKDVINILN